MYREPLLECTRRMDSTANSGPTRIPSNIIDDIIRNSIVINVQIITVRISSVKFTILNAPFKKAKFCLLPPLLSSSDNYIESAVRGDNLNFHLVIDIEWVSLGDMEMFCHTLSTTSLSCLQVG